MVKLRFYWDGCATFEDDDEYTEMELVENYEGDSWKECCDDCASCSLDWDDGDLVTGEPVSILLYLECLDRPKIFLVRFALGFFIVVDSSIAINVL